MEGFEARWATLGNVTSTVSLRKDTTNSGDWNSSRAESSCADHVGVWFWAVLPQEADFLPSKLSSCSVTDSPH